MVVCEDGRMKRASTASSGSVAAPRAGRSPATIGRAAILDDFAAMHEVVGRRYRALLEQGGPFPDLIVIDGGKGQLSAAYAALEELGLANLVAVGLAKKEELLFTRDRDEPIALAPSTRRCSCCSASATRRTASP